MRPGIGPPPDRRRPPNPQVKKSSIIKEIKAEFRANKVRAGRGQSLPARHRPPRGPPGMPRRRRAHQQPRGVNPGALPPPPCAPPCATQAVAEPEQVQRCRVLAERGLSDLQAYSSAAAAPGGDASISLKGATQ